MEKKTIENMDYNYELYTQIENLKIIREWINDTDILLRRIEKMDINNIQKQIEEAYQKGVEDGRNKTWEAARKIVLYRDEGGTSILDLTEIFDCCTIQQVFRKYTVFEAIAKLKAYEEKADKDVKRGDVVRSKVNGLTYIVTIASEGGYVLLGSDGNFATSCITNSFEKTGRHFDIDKILEAMKE